MYAYKLNFIVRTPLPKQNARVTQMNCKLDHMAELRPVSDQ